jgi:hypothetical protein
VDPSRPLNLRACLWTYQVIDDTGNFDGTIDYTVLGRIGIDPTGGTDRNSPNVVWSAWSSGQQWFDVVPAYSADHPSRYTDLMLTVQPQSSQATVFLEAGCNSAIKWTIYAWDDVHAWQDQPVQEVSSVGALRSLADGTRVRLGTVVVTADAASAGAVYVQQPDRSSGIRVETGSQATEGTLVTVEGTLATKPSGERFLQEAQILSPTPGTSAIPMGQVFGHRLQRRRPRQCGIADAVLGAGNIGRRGIRHGQRRLFAGRWSQSDRSGRRDASGDRDNGWRYRCGAVGGNGSWQPAGPPHPEGIGRDGVLRSLP